MGEFRETIICFGTYNIQNRRNGGLDSSLWGVEQANVNLVVFKDTKVADGFYTRTLARYRVFTTAALSWHHDWWSSSTGTPPISRSRRYISMGGTC